MNTEPTPTLAAVAPATTCYALRVLKWAHCGKEGWMSEYATNIEIEDEGAGEFLLLTQPFASTKLSNGGIAITAEEWPTLRAAIEAAIEDISQHNSVI
jgi:GTP-dependent phosphoenolpyruvate carboxykinase